MAFIVFFYTFVVLLKLSLFPIKGINGDLDTPVLINLSGPYLKLRPAIIEDLPLSNPKIHTLFDARYPPFVTTKSKSL